MAARRSSSAKRTLPFRSALAALVAFAGAASAVLGSAAETGAPPLQLALVVAGRPARAVPGLREGTALLIALEPALDALGFAFRRDGDDGDSVEVGGSWYALAAGSRMARQAGTEALPLAIAPVLREQLYVAPADLGALLGLDLAVDGTRIGAAEADADHDGTVVEERPIPRRRAPDSRYERSGATPPPVAVEAPVAFVGRVGLTLVDTAGQQSRQLSLQGAGDGVHGSIMAEGSDGSASVNGSIFLGDRHHSTTLGGVSDPLGGTVFAASAAEGVEVARADGRLDFADALRADGSRVYAFEEREHSRSSELALLTRGGRLRGLLLGERRFGARPGFTYAADAWTGSRGVAAGASAKTTGKLFLSAAAAVASSGLPLVVGDAPRTLSLGYRLTPALTVSGGSFSALGIPPSAFTAANLHLARGSLGISRSRSETTLSASANGSATTLALDFTRAAGETNASLDAGAALRRGALELSGTAATDRSGDASLRWRSERTGPSLLAGIERTWTDSASRLGPVMGLALPLFAGMSVEASIHPLLRGNGVRLAIVQDLIRHTRAPTKRVTVHLPATAGPSQVWVDGTPFARLAGGDGTLDIPAAARSIAVRTLDGRSGSPTVPLPGAEPSRLELPVWPLRAVRGRVAVESANPIDAGISLEHTIVVLEAGDIIAEVQADGSFTLPPQPLPPSATVRIDEDTLPDAFAAGPPVPVAADGDTILTVHGRRTVERKRF